MVCSDRGTPSAARLRHRTKQSRRRRDRKNRQGTLLSVPPGRHHHGGMGADGTTTERYEQRIGRAMALIEQRLAEPLTLDRLAAEACLSPFHFHRVFHALVGETVHEFTTRLRLERALSLAHGNPGWTWARIAHEVGYRSPAVFSRAFRRRHGCAPGAFDRSRHGERREDVAAVHRVSAHFLRPAEPLPAGFRVDVVHWPQARRVLARTRGGYLDPAILIDGYRRLTGWAERFGLPLGDGRLSGASQDDPEITPLARCRYDFALVVDEPVRPDRGLVASVRPAGWWAVHAVAGDMAAVDRAWNLLFKCWLPGSACELRSAPAEEVYLRTPAETGWERFDLLCCIPIEPPTDRRQAT
jgi:AraC family transcriptional regulator